jgi:dephospho-CoA kinase
MLKAGLTGNIGSGKSAVARVFEALGVPVYDADAKAKEILDEPDVISSIIFAFGTKVTDITRKIDRKILAAIVFNDEAQLALLNSIIHPRLLKDFERWAGEKSAQPYVLMESAILFDTDYYKLFDKIIVVSAPEDVRMARVMKRDNATEKSVRARMQHQKPESEIIPQAHFVVVNDDKSLVIPQVLKIHEELGVMSREL